MGAQIEIDRNMIIIPANLFFYYLSKNESLITIDTIWVSMGNPVDIEICRWMFEYFMGQIESYDDVEICYVTVSAYYNNDKSYFENLMQIVSDKKLNDVVMLNILNYESVNDYNLKYILYGEYHDELIFFSLLRRMWSNNTINVDCIKLKKLFKSNREANIIYQEITSDDAYGEKFDHRINNIRSLMNMFQD
jgi:hypothetical protein